MLRCSDSIDRWRQPLVLAAHYGSVEPISGLSNPYKSWLSSAAAQSLIGKPFTFDDIAAVVETEFPEARPLHRASGGRTVLATPLLREGIAIGVILDSPNGSPTIYRQADRSAQDLCRPGGHRHRECPLVQRTPGAQRRIARGSGASDRNGRGARHHQPLADGRATGPRRHRRECGPGLWD